MARLNVSDFLQNFRFFAVELAPPPDRAATDKFLKVAAAFTNIVAPDVTTEIVEYRDGMSVLTKKQPTWPTFSDITFVRGVVRGDSEFFNWMDATVGGVPYRADLEIQHFHRVGWFINQPARKYKLLEAMPSSVKVASDLDAQSGDISLAELVVAYEGLDLIES
jgi:phage tail-like protein